MSDSLKDIKLNNVQRKMLKRALRSIPERDAEVMMKLCDLTGFPYDEMRIRYNSCSSAELVGVIDSMKVLIEDIESGKLPVADGELTGV